MIFKFPKFY